MNGKTFLLGLAVMKMHLSQNLMIIQMTSLNFGFGLLTEDKHWLELVLFPSNLEFSVLPCRFMTFSWLVNILASWFGMGFFTIFLIKNLEKIVLKLIIWLVGLLWRFFF